MSDITWPDYERRCRALGLFDEADYAREKQHFLDCGYGYLPLRGHQTTGDRIWYARKAVQPTQIYQPKTTPSTQPAVQSNTPRLFDLLR